MRFSLDHAPPVRPSGRAVQAPPELRLLVDFLGRLAMGAVAQMNALAASHPIPSVLER
jgi:hypothetical protein